MTLIEALVVVAVSALVSAVAFPNMRAARDAASFRAETAALAADLRSARAQAQRRGAPVVFTTAADGWAWTGAPRRVARARVAAVPPRPIRFFADGSSDGGAVTLALGARRAQVAVDADTGAVLR